MEYFRGALRLLTEALPPGRVPTVVLSMSRGNEAALLSAIHLPDLVNGVVVTVPGNLVTGSWPPAGPAKVLDGQPLPYVKGAGPPCDKLRRCLSPPNSSADPFS